jgi:uncharacterized Ntn-hydrolase superfamily protein
MTYSIVARDAATGHLGVAVASRFFAVGAVVPYVRGGVGAVATQSFVNPLNGVDGLAMLADGMAVDDIVAALAQRDAGRDGRQFHLIDAAGNNAAYTGAKCVDWAGHLSGDNVSVAGNMLTGPGVVAATMEEYGRRADLPFVERLLAAMQAGEEAGGDKRGKQSAALVVHRDQDYPWLSLRADDHRDPLAELNRLYAVAQERYLYFVETMATRANPSGMVDRSEVDAKIVAVEKARIAEGRTSASFGTPLKIE